MEWQQPIIEQGPSGPDVVEEASAVEQRYQTWFDMNPSLTKDDRVLLSVTRGTE